MIEALEQLFPPELLLQLSVLVVLFFLIGAFWAHRIQIAGRQLRTRVLAFGLPQSVHEKIHGGKSSHYFDADLFLGRPDNIQLVADWFERALDAEAKGGKSIDRLAFMENRAGPVGALGLRELLSWRTRIASVTLRKRRRGPAFRIKGLERALLNRTTRDLSEPSGPKGLNSFLVDSSRERVAIISDVATSGKTIEEGVDMVRDAGGTVEVALVIYDRQEGAVELLQKRGVRLVSMLRGDTSSLDDAAA